MGVDVKSRRVLVVDDDPDSLEIISESLRWEGYQVDKAISGKQAIEKIEHWEPDLVLLDVNMPGLSGFETLKLVRAKSHYVAVMFISGQDATESIVEGLDSGADDYIVKPFDPHVLLARVRTQLRIKDLNDQLRAANVKLKELVDIDDLTGLYNMRSVYHRLDSEIDRARRFGRQVAIIMMDMDRFKSVNDGHDHLFGSFVLSEVGAIIHKSIRSIDLAARYGGDEFLIMITEATKEGTYNFCERLRKKISETLFKHEKDEIRLTASLGFAVTHPGEDAVDARSLVKMADHCLYEAKRSGRNCVKFLEVPHTDHQKKKAS